MDDYKPRPLPSNAKPERNTAIWRERKEEGTPLRALGEKHGLTTERIRQIVAKEDRIRKRREYFNAQRRLREGANT